MSSERLDALLRQRALLTQHLAWLDDEIARAAGATPVTTSAPAAPSVASLPTTSNTAAPDTPAAVSPQANHTPATPTSAAPATAIPAAPSMPIEAAPDALAAANARADEIIAQYSQSDRFDEKGAKRGCMLLAIAVFLFGLAAILGVYLLRYRQ